MILSLYRILILILFLKVLPGSKVEWEPDSKQGVYLLPAPTPATSLSYSATFDPEEGDFTFAFEVS